MTDDVSVPFTSNLQLTMHRPQKYHTNPMLPLGELGEPDEWQHRYYGTVLRQDGKFMMWYIASAKEAFLSPTFRPGHDFDPRGLRYAYAESDDGIRWRKPKLGLVEFRGSRDNNLIQVPRVSRAITPSCSTTLTKRMRRAASKCWPWSWNSGSTKHILLPEVTIEAPTVNGGSTG